MDFKTKFSQILKVMSKDLHDPSNIDKLTYPVRLPDELRDELMEPSMMDMLRGEPKKVTGLMLRIQGDNKKNDSNKFSRRISKSYK